METKFIQRPSVTSLKYSFHPKANGFKNYTRKSQPPIQLQSFMSELIQNPVLYQMVHRQDLDQFQRLGRLNRLHQMEIGGYNHQYNEPVTGNKQNSSFFKTEVIMKQKATSRPFSSCHVAPKETSIHNRRGRKVKEEVSSFTKTLKEQDRVRNVKFKKSDILTDIQRRSRDCLGKFILNNQKKEILSYVDQLLRETQTKTKNQIAGLLSKIAKLQTEKDQFQRTSLQLKLEMRTLQKSNQENKAKVDQLSETNSLISGDLKSLSRFVQEFEAVKRFQPAANCRSLIAKYSQMEQLCLNKLSYPDDTKGRAAEHQLSKIKEELSSTQLSFKVVSNNLQSANQELKELRGAEKQNLVDVDRLKHAQRQLQQLQNKVLDFYNKWYQNVGSSIKGILEQSGCLEREYSYIQMLDYVSVYMQNLSTPYKINQYLRKVLATIQLAQRRIFPQSVHSGKMDPVKAVQEIVSYALCVRGAATKVRSIRHNPIQKAQTLQAHQDAKYITEV